MENQAHRRLMPRFSSCLPLAALLALGLGLANNSASAQASFDWRYVGSQNHNYLTPVEQQGSEGDCWAFSACGTMEAGYKLTRYDWESSDNLILSEEYLCYSGKFGGSFSGGNADSVLGSWAAGNVAIRDSELQYTGTTPKSGQWPLQSGWASRAAALNGSIGGSGSVNTIKTLLKEYGPLDCNTSSYFGGAHDVVIVGYNDNYVVGDGTTGALIIKNSWGTGWQVGSEGPGYGVFPYSQVKSGGGLYAYPIIGQTYYTGAMTNATWTGGNGNWVDGGSGWTTSGGSYHWQNLETLATFNQSNNVTLTGNIWLHGIQFAGGSGGATISGQNRLTITAGGINCSDNVTISSPVTVGAPSTWSVAAGKTMTFAGLIDLHISPLTVSGSGNLIVNGLVRDVATNPEFTNLLVAAAMSLTKSGTGNLTLASPNTYTGGTTIASGGGTLTITSPGGLGTGPVTIATAGSDTGTLQLALTGNNTINNSFTGLHSITFSSSPTATIENVSGTNTITSALSIVSGGGNGMVVQSDAGLLQLAGNISVSATLANRGLYLTGAGNGLVSGKVTDGADPFALQKNGAGIWTLSGANSYSGDTAVNAGTLLVNGAIAGGAVTVASGAALGGTGTIGGAVTVQSGGTFFAPGAPYGTLTINNSFSLAGNLYVELNKSASPANDLAKVSGTLNNTGIGTVTVTNAGLTALAAGDRFQLFNQALVNGDALTITPAPGIDLAWKNNLAVDGSIEVVSLNIPPGVAVQVSVETAADGTGTVVPAQAIVSGQSLTVYAIARDVVGSFVTNVVAAWTTVNDTGGVQNGNLSPSSGPSSTFTGNLTGAGQILASVSGLTSLASGLISVTPVSLVWSAAPANSQWNTTSTNWTGGTGIFGNGDSVQFTDAGSAALPITLVGALSPGLVTVNVTNNNYVFSGSGYLGGTNSLVMSGLGTLTVSNSSANTYSGGTFVNGGTLVVATTNGCQLGQGSITIATGGTLFLDTGVATWSNNVSGAGRWQVGTGTGSQATTLAGNYSAFAGTLEVTNGGAKIALQNSAGYPSASAMLQLDANETAFIAGGGTFASAIQLYGGTTGEALGQLRLGSATGGTFSGPVTLLADTTIGVDNGRAATISGNMGGSYGFTKLSAGPLTLSGNNTYTGNTIINAGSLILGATGSISNSASLAIDAGATFDVSAITDFALNRTALNASGTGITVGTNAATIKGASGGTVSLGTNVVALTYDGLHPALYFSQGTLLLGGNPFTVNTAAPLATGTYHLVQQASGNIVMSLANPDAVNTVTGTAIGPGEAGFISLNGGNVTLTVDGVVAATINVETAADGSGTVVPAQSLAAGGSLTVYAIARAADGSFVANVAARWSALTLTGGCISGNLVPAGDNKSATFTGSLIGTAVIDASADGWTSIDSGTLTVLLGPASKVLVETAADGSGTVVPAQNLTPGNSLTVYAISRDAGGNFITNAPADSWTTVNDTGGVQNGNLWPNSGASSTFTANASGSGQISANISGLTSVISGVITVGAQGATEYAAGGFTWNNNSTAKWSLTPGGPYNQPWTNGNNAVFEGAAGTVTISGVTANTITFNTSGYTLSSGILTLTNNGLPPTITLGGSGYSDTISSVIAGSAGLAVVAPGGTGYGSLSLSGANTYTGGTALSGNARVVALAAGAFGYGSVTVADGSGVYLSSGNSTNSFTLSGNGYIGDNPPLGAIRLNANIIASGTVTLAANTRLWANVSAQVATNSGVISDGGSGYALELGGHTGALVLTAANTYTGGTTLTTGEADFANNSALGGNTVTVNSGILAATGSGAKTLANNFIFNGSFKLGGAAAGSPQAAILNGLVDLGGLTNTITLGNSATFGGVVSDGGLTLANTGSSVHTLTLGGANSYPGPTTVGVGTLLNLANQYAVQNSTLTMSGGTNSIQFNSAVAANAFTVGGLAANSSGPGYNIGLTNTTSQTAITLSVGNNNANTTYAGVLSAAGSLSKIGTGILTFSGANTYTGATTITAGTLAMGAAGSISNSSALAIAAGATFDVSAIPNYNLSGATALSASGAAAAAVIKGAAGGAVNLGSQPITLTYDGADPALDISQGTLSVNGNQFTVNAAAPLPAGTYAVIQQASGSITSAGPYPAVTGTAIDAAHTGTIGVSGSVVNLVISTLTASYSTNLNSRVSGGTLSLSWSGTHLGWILQNQTSALGLGLGTNWVDVPGTAGVTATNITLNPASPTVFFRLRHP